MTVKSLEDKPKVTALFPGSFNPFTIGHLDILVRGLNLFDRIVVGVGYNSQKEGEENIAGRVETIKKAVMNLPRVEVKPYHTLTVDFAAEIGASVILRGIRSVADFEYERNMAEANKKIGGIETVILTADPQLAYISSSLVRELENFGYDIGKFLPPTD